MEQPKEKPTRKKKEKVCDHCKGVYTCSRKEHQRSPECYIGQIHGSWESIRSDPSEENPLNLNIDLQKLKE